MLNPNELVIGPHNYTTYQNDQVVNGERKARGGIPRDFKNHPRGCYAGVKAVDLVPIDRSEWAERCADMIAKKSRLSDIRMTGNAGGMVPSQDQNGKGYCWAHSTTGNIMLLRAVQNQPYIGLSAYAVACIIKSYRDEGGWGAQSADWIAANGVPSEAFWPMRSMSRSNDNPAMRENAAKHKLAEQWADMNVAQYDRKLTFDQFATCWLSRVPTVCDFNWWSHSVGGMDLVNGTALFNAQGLRGESGKLYSVADFEAIWEPSGPTAGYGVRIWNSWGDSWSAQGAGVLTGSQAIPDGGVAPLVTGISEA